MTTLQIEMNKLRETQRSNRAKENETRRSNLATETETHRSNTAQEKLKDRQVQLDEQYNPYKIKESQTKSTYNEAATVEKVTKAGKNVIDSGAAVSEEIRKWSTLSGK